MAQYVINIKYPKSDFMLSARYFVITILYCLLSFVLVKGQLAVSANGRYLIDNDSKPFFWLGDTGWALFQKLSREEIDFYFKTRARQGFSVVHAAVYHVNPFVLPPKNNMYGDRPFINDDPLKPAETPGNDPEDQISYDYWDHVEYVINTASTYGIYINLLPIFGLAEGEGYNVISPDNAYEYGKFIGNRFKDKKNIIWCMGGDVLADNDLRKSIWNLLAKGVTEGVAGEEDYSKTLMTFHVRGGHSSSEYFPDVPWLDFHMLQTWASYTKIYDAVKADYERLPVKPILHGEGAYEDGPEYPTKPITPYVIRKQAYWAIFAGGLHTYGNSNVWNFGTNPEYVSEDWEKALKSDGAKQMTIFRTILESIKWWEFVPDNSVIAEILEEGDHTKMAMCDSKGNRILVYLTQPSSVIINFAQLKGTGRSIAFWFNPKTGKKKKINKIVNAATMSFSTPKGWEDAVLLIEAEKKK